VTITVIVIGRAGSALKGAIEEFEGRASRYWKLRVVELPSGTAGKGRGHAGRVLKQEQDAILKKIPDRAEVIALTRGGSPMSSPKFSEYLQNLALRSVQDAAFVVGGLLASEPA